MFMSLKLLKLRWRIFLWTLNGKIKSLRSRLKLHLSPGNPQKILIIFPMDEPSFRVALYTFRDLGKSSQRNRNYFFVVRKQFEELFHLQYGNSIFINNTDEQSPLPDESYLQRNLQHHHFDIIVDLNPEFYLGVARLISSLNGNMKVGFTSKFADKFYNVQLDISKTGIMEKAFNQVNLILT